MRIIIEADEQERSSTAIQMPEEPAHIEAMDGGAPSETLLQAVADSLPVSTEMEEMDAGPPPQWLVEAIEGTSQPGTAGLTADADAGSAPNE